MLAPASIKNLQQNLLFDLAELAVCGELCFGVIGVGRRFFDALRDFDVRDAFFAGPLSDGEFQA